MVGKYAVIKMYFNKIWDVFGHSRTVNLMYEVHVVVVQLNDVTCVSEFASSFITLFFHFHRVHFSHISILLLILSLLHQLKSTSMFHGILPAHTAASLFLLWWNFSRLNNSFFGVHQKEYIDAALLNRIRIVGMICQWCRFILHFGYLVMHMTIWEHDKSLWQSFNLSQRH